MNRVLRAYLCHLLLPLCLGGLCVSVVVCLDDDEVVGLGVDHKLPGRALQWEGHLVEDRAQLLQRQDPSGEKGGGGGKKQLHFLTETLVQ